MIVAAVWEVGCVLFPSEPECAQTAAAVSAAVGAVFGGGRKVLGWPRSLFTCSCPWFVRTLA